MDALRPWTHYLPTGLDNLPAATAHTNTRLTAIVLGPEGNPQFSIAINSQTVQLWI